MKFHVTLMLFGKSKTVYPEPVEGCGIEPFMLRHAQHEWEDFRCLYNY